MENKTNLNLNEIFSDLMDKIASIYIRNGEPFKARAYQKAQETIIGYKENITNPSQLNGLPNIGKSIINNLTIYFNTGTLDILEKDKNNPINILSNIYGIGPKKAQELCNNGITSIEILRENQHLLNDIQKIGLIYYEDILERIPRNEIEEYKKIFLKNFSSKGQDNLMEIVGSYRRGLSSSGDIDVILTSQNNNNLLNEFVDNLLEENIILHILSRGPTKCLVIAKLPGYQFARRVDFLYTNKNEFPFALLYFTGSKYFNTVMRSIALENGYTMNEHGIYHIINKKKGPIVDKIFIDEKDIFDFLNLEFKEPHQRINGNDIIKKTNISIPESKAEDLNTPEIFVIKKSLINKKSMKIKSKFNENIRKTKKNNNIFNNEIIEQFKKNGIEILKSCNEKQLNDLILYANDCYYNQSPIMSDCEYDILKEFVENKYGINNDAIKAIGAPISIKKNKVQLPYPMGSMNKIKPYSQALLLWQNTYNGPYLISCKLDGVSGLYSTENEVPKLYSRGDGLIGQDISHLIPYLRLPKEKGLAIRGEFIIPKNIFDTKYKSQFANSRNMVAGLINQKGISPALNDLHFVAYELLNPHPTPYQQLQHLFNLNIEVVYYEYLQNITNEILSETLIKMRTNYIYDIDGLIITNDSNYKIKAGNPEHSFAFKMVLSEQIAEAKVIDVIWNISKDGYLKPRVQIEPINLGGVFIEYATGFNASFINNNKIGVGAIIEIIRSGDVIPYIRKVIIPANDAKMPTNIKYKWNDTGIDIIVENIEDNEDIREKNIAKFFKEIGVEGLSSGNIKRIIDAGYNSISKILKMEISDFLKVDGFKDKTSNKLYNGIREKITQAKLIKIMSSSNIFGRGFSDKKLELIIDNFPNVLTSNMQKNEMINKISSINGMGTKSAIAFVEKIPNFIEFLNETNLIYKLEEFGNLCNYSANTSVINIDKNHPLYEKSIVISGFRDAILMQKLKSFGAKIGNNISSKTFALIVKNKMENTTKINDAKNSEIPILTIDEFANLYF